MKNKIKRDRRQIDVGLISEENGNKNHKKGKVENRCEKPNRQSGVITRFAGVT